MAFSGGLRQRFAALDEKIRLHGNEEHHEQTDAWSNRDLIPLPPQRRTWGWFHFFGFWAISSLNIANWQYPNTYLTLGLSVRQSMMVIVVGRFLICIFATLVAGCGLRWHIGYTVQNRFSWGLRGSYIPLLQRVLLNFIWAAVQLWNGGRLVAVCLTAIWPSFNTMKDHLPSSVPATTPEFVAFFLFWLISLPFLAIPPEKFKVPFQVVSVYCAVGMICMMIWALAEAKGLGPLWNTGATVPATARFNVSWIIMEGINELVGGISAGISNGSDFSRYSRNWQHFVGGTFISAWVVGVVVSLIGLVTTSASQKIYGDIYWNPPDLLMVMMDSGHGSSKARVGVFFLSLGFALTSMFENICGNVVAGGIDLAGIFPRYINIRRGAIITIVAAWIAQPWELINKATSFIDVLDSFAVFLSPIIGIMVTDFYLLRRGKVRLTHLYKSHDSQYWFWHGINWRACVAWTCGVAPTIGGLVVETNGSTNPNRVLMEIFYMTYFVGFLTSCLVFYVVNKVFPPAGLGDYDEVDTYGTFTVEEAAKLGVVPAGETIIESVPSDSGEDNTPGGESDKNEKVHVSNSVL